jgi:hypothetical protein
MGGGRYRATCLPGAPPRPRPPSSATSGGRPTARRFAVRSRLGSTTAGIVSAPFLHRSFKAVSYAITRSLGRGGALRYRQDTVQQIAGRRACFHHVDESALRRVAGPRPNPVLVKGRVRPGAGRPRRDSAR